MKTQRFTFLVIFADGFLEKQSLSMQDSTTLHNEQSKTKIKVTQSIFCSSHLIFKTIYFPLQIVDTLMQMKYRQL